MTEESIFAAALEKDPAERAAFLDAACGADQALRHAIDQLLAAHDAEGVLDRPVFAGAEAPTTAAYEGAAADTRAERFSRFD